MIVPASQAPDFFKGKGATGTWTPSANDVAVAERELATYLKRAAHREAVEPPISMGVSPPFDYEELGQLVDGLREFKR